MEQQVAVKTMGYKKLHVTVMLCITTNGNKLPLYVILNRKTVPKEKFCKDVIVWAKKKKYIDDIRVNGRLALMCMGMSAWCIIKATEYACNGYFLWPSLRQNQK
jgi:hypothetical protein